MHCVTGVEEIIEKEDIRSLMEIESLLNPRSKDKLILDRKYYNALEELTDSIFNISNVFAFDK